VTGGSVAVSGATFDYLYALAGLAGVVTLIVHRRQIFVRRKAA
jgi:hypothetical protein